MKYAVRMVIIPEAEYKSLKPDKKASKTRKTKREAAVQISQELGLKIRKRNQIKALHRQQEHQPPESSRFMLELFDYLPASYHAKARTVLSELLNKGFAWTYKGEVTLPSGQKLIGSNIGDLLREALVQQQKKDTPKPIAWIDFIAGIVNSGVTQSLFSKKSTREAINRHIPGQIPDWVAY